MRRERLTCQPSPHLSFESKTKRRLGHYGMFSVLNLANLERPKKVAKLDEFVFNS